MRASKTGMTRGVSRCGFRGGVPFPVLWRTFGTLGGDSLLGTLEAVLGHAEAVRAPPLHEKMHAPVCTLLLSFRPPPSRAQVLQCLLQLRLYGEASSVASACRHWMADRLAQLKCMNMTITKDYLDDVRGADTAVKCAQACEADANCGGLCCSGLP